MAKFIPDKIENILGKEKNVPSNNSPGVKFDPTPGGYKFYMGLYMENFRSLPLPSHKA